MSTNFPSTSIDTFPTHATGDVIEASFDNNEQDAIVALETKVGIDGSAVTTSHDYKLSGVTGSDKAVSLTGTEALTNKTLTAPVITSPTLNLGSDAEGDTYYRNGAGALVRLAKGTDNYIYKMNGNVPNWEAEAVISNATTTSAGISELATSAQITAGTATESGNPLVVTPDQLALSTPVFNGSGLTRVSRLISQSASSTAASTANTNENTWVSQSIAGGTLSTGNVVRIKMQGTWLNQSGTAVITIRMKYGSTTMITHTLTESGSTLLNFNWEIVLHATGSTSTQTMSSVFHAITDLTTIGSPTTSLSTQGTGTATEASTGALNFVITSQYSTTSNVQSVTIKSLVIEQLA